MQGESLVRKDFSEIARICRDLGFGMIGVATNGTLLSNMKRLEELVDFGVGFEFSIHSHLEQSANRISGRDFTWKRQRKALENIKTLGARARASFNTVICMENAGHLDGLAAYLSGFVPAERFMMNLKFPFITGRAVGFPGSIPRYDALDMTPLFCFMKKQGLDFRLENFPLCHVPGNEHRVIKTIDMIHKHDYFSRADGEKDYAAMGRYIAGYSRPAACRSCTLRKICPGLDDRYVETFGSGEVRPKRKSPEPIARRILRQAGRSIRERTSSK